METSTVVPGGDLAGRNAEYRRGYVAGLMTAWPFHVFIGGIVVLAVSAVGAIGAAWSRADRAAAQLADWAKTPVACMTIWPQQCGGEAANLRQRIEWKTAEADGWRSAAVQCHARREVR